MQCVVDISLLLWCQMCAAAGRQGWACTFACKFVCTLLAASAVVIDLVFAALAACLLVRSARHGTAHNDDGHVDDATRLPACVRRRVLGGFGGRPLGRAQLVRSCLDLAAWLAGVWVFDGLTGASCWRRLRRWRLRCCGTGGRGWVGGWVRGRAGGNAVRSRLFVIVVVADVCDCRPAGSGMYVRVYVCLHVAGGVRCMGSYCCSLRL